ncbi:hypothetical protein [uncultured Gammaproteobacteria bacterium]|nr:hypothetical protein [uncultured Gammaproteobacteria bacterium]
MFKNLLTLYFSFYLVLSPIFAQANSTPQIANQFNHKVPTQDITINSDGTIINSSNITSEQNTNTNDNRASHYGEDNNIYLIDDNINNTKDLTTTIGHETSHALDNQDPSINTNPQNNASKTDNEIYADNYGDDFGDYVEFASENYGDGNLASTNNHTGNDHSQILKENNQKYARIDKSKGEDFLKIGQQSVYAEEMTKCGINGHECKNNTRRKYKKLYDKNQQEKLAEIKRELSKPSFLRNKYKTKQELESAINLVNNRPFKQEIIKIPEQNLNGVETTRTEEYVSGFEQKTKKDLKAVAKTGFGLTAPGRVYEIGKGVVDLADDLESGNFEKTANNVIDRATPKGLRGAGISKTASDQIGAGIGLGRELGNNE